MAEQKQVSKATAKQDNYAHWILKRLLILLVVTLVMLIIGLMIGYKLGGGNPFRVFLPSTWQHIFSFFH
ncbi:DNA-directed RNA polymerase subunit beta [Lactobacillus sp. CC-MHH1034]|uniref:DNA-directed RNA polymerase subunit beta n=1 Tax=Agrilactobacillus fermenti TaxID=2586909 RepID=UPI001E3FC750|nr:DNA-directed RNA polymerase subunit beta [Agrilactobacillus fermenti]MCD2256444.1 DNA-directed RNA polymerase subunit beta [Agrilactobacillus fermenti]